MHKTLVLFLMLTTPGWATTYYVRKTGSDSNSCSQAAQYPTSPKKTIWGGIRCLSPGDRLEIGGGFYLEPGFGVYTGIPSGLDDSHRTVISNYGTETPIIQYIPTGNGTGFEINNRSYITVQNLYFNNKYDGQYHTTEQIIYMRNSHHIQLTNLDVANSYWVAMFLQRTSHHVSVTNCKFHGSFQEHGVYTEASYNTFDQCEFYNNPKQGMQLYCGYSGCSSSNNIVRNSKFHDNVGQGLLANGAYNLIYNNQVYHNSHDGIAIGYWNGNYNKLYNNTIYQNTGPGINIGIYNSNVQGNIVRNNILYLNSYGGQQIRNGGLNTVLSCNLMSDPYFVDAYGENFQLQSFSPAVNKACTLAEFSTDTLGRLRPKGLAWDIGAFECY